MAATAPQSTLSGLPRRLVQDGIVAEAVVQDAAKAALKEKTPLVAYLVANDMADSRTFGNNVHQDIFGDTLSVTPYLTAGGSIIWRCGAAPVPVGTVELTGGGVTAAHLAPTVAQRYLPGTCRQ